MTKIYTLTIFTSAFLLFLIQPMISKLLLPYLGGTPALWNTSMMFFQMLLLLGYAYAHFSVKWLGAKRQACVHFVLLLCAIAWLPVVAKTQLGFESVQYPICWVMVSLFLSVGAPFFVLSANAPLLQYWLSETDHKDAQNPYFLYSASNIGSLLALGGYPFVIEPLLTLVQQTQLWSVVFLVFIVCISGCIWCLRGRYVPQAAAVVSEVAPTAKQKMGWVALAFFPSSLLLGVTTYITLDIASIPLFWVVPLALYLITFILAFARVPMGVDFALKAQVVLVPITALALASRINHATLILLLHLLTFFVLTLGCHGTLARQKPHPKYLTEYFLWVSFGGMLGGVFNALVAPQIFTSLVEYPLVLGLALLARPAPGASSARDKRLDVVVPGIIVALALAFVVASHMGAGAVLLPLLQHEAVLQALAVVLCVGFTLFAVSLAKRPVRFAFSFLALVLLAPLVNGETTLVYAERNFFGVNRVYVRPSDNAMLLMHGTTVHGIQALDPDLRMNLTSYYSVLADVFGHLSDARRDDPVAVLGLGAGTIACLGHAGQAFDFYEIDPAVAAIAGNADYFTYLKDCPPASHVQLGDGRLEIAKMADARYGVMVVDAFSSDSIPVHLLTREALAIYESKLGAGGLLAFNISNRHLNLEPLMLVMAKDANLVAMIKKDAHPKGVLTTSSVWVVMAKDAKDFNGLGADSGWAPLEGDAHVAVWTDNYSNILQTLF